MPDLLPSLQTLTDQTPSTVSHCAAVCESSSSWCTVGCKSGASDEDIAGCLWAAGVGPHDECCHNLLMHEQGSASSLLHIRLRQSFSVLVTAWLALLVDFVSKGERERVLVPAALCCKAVMDVWAVKRVGLMKEQLLNVIELNLTCKYISYLITTY